MGGKQKLVSQAEWVVHRPCVQKLVSFVIPVYSCPIYMHLSAMHISAYGKLTHCHAYGSQQQLCLNKVCDLTLTWIFWGVTRMRWCHLWELLGFELGVSVHLPASRGTLPVGIGVGICVCVCRCVVGSCSCVSTRGCMRCLGSRVCNCL